MLRPRLTFAPRKRHGRPPFHRSRPQDPAVGRRPRGFGRAGEEGAVARELDDPQRQSRQARHGRPQGRRPSGFLGLPRRHHVRALFPRAAPRRPGGGEAPRQPHLPRHPVSVRPPEPGAAGEFPRLQGRAILPLPHQGCRRRGLLHRLGGLGRRADAVRQSRAGLRPRPRPRRRPPEGADDRPRGRCGAGRRQRLRGPSGGLEARGAQHLVDHRLQPPEPRRRGARRPLRALHRHLRGHGLAGGGAEVRRPAAGRFCRARRRGAEALDRHLPQRRIFRAHLPGRCSLAQAPDGRPRRPGGRLRSHRPAYRCRIVRADDQSRRPRYRFPHRRLRRHRPRPAGGLPLLHGEGLRPAAGRPQGQPRRPDDPDPDGGVARVHERGRRPRMGTVRGADAP